MGLGRILVPLYWYERRILRQPTFYLSGYLETHRDQYVSALRGLEDLVESDGAWNRWIALFLRKKGHLATAAREHCRMRPMRQQWMAINCH
jgi:Fic family protein